MAVLAAYDIVDLYPWRHVQVYTVGAPRPGNQAFADKYDAKVPDTWHVINPAVRPRLQCNTVLAASSFLSCRQSAKTCHGMTASCFSAALN